MLNIDIKTIPHKVQRYPTVGDYYRDGHKLHFRISEMQDKRYEFLVAIHELVEQFGCELNGTKMDDIDKFDIAYEKARDSNQLSACGCKITDTSEPGDDRHAPYYHWHQIATAVERLLAVFLKVDWEEYDRKVNELP